MKVNKFDFSGEWWFFSKIMSYCENLNFKKQIPFLKDVLDKLHSLAYRERINDPFYRMIDIGNGGDGRWPAKPWYIDAPDYSGKLKHDIEGEIERIERELKESSFHCFDPKKVEELRDGIFYDIATLLKILPVDKTTFHSFIINGFQDSAGKKIGFEELEAGSVLRIGKLYKIKGSVIKKMIAAGIID